MCLIREENTIVACGTNGCVSFFDFKHNNHFKAPSYYDVILRSICFSANEDRFITGTEDGTVEVWLTNGYKRQFFEKKHSAAITSIKISTCSKLFATGSQDTTVIIWDFNKFQSTRFIEKRSEVCSLYFVKNSSSLLICWGFGIDWCSLSTFVSQEKIEAKWLNSIAISSDLKYGAYGVFCVCLIEIGNKKKVAKSSNKYQIIVCLKFSPNSAFVAAGYLGGEITIFSIPNLVYVCSLLSNLSRIHFLSISRSNEFIGFSDSISVKLMSIKTKKVLYEKAIFVITVCFCSNDEKFIYSDRESIYVIENLSFLKKISFGVGVRKLFVNDEGSYVFVRNLNRRWSILKAGSLEKIFEDVSKTFVKEWCAKRQEIIFQTQLNFHLF